MEGIILYQEVYNIIMKFRSRYQECGRSEEHRQQVEHLIREGTPTSLKKLARILGDISYVTVRAILRLDSKAQPYHMELLYHLNCDDERWRATRYNT
jgi:hypothetical protein